MNTFYEPKFLPLTGIPNKFACDRDLIFAAAADGRIKLWTYAEHWLDAIKKAGIDERVDYVELAPQDAVGYRTSSVRALSRAMVRDKVVTAETAAEVPDGNLFVDVAQAKEVFPLRPEPSPLPLPPPADLAPSEPEDDADDESLSDKEEKHLWKTIGALVLFVSDEKGGLTYGGKPNANRIAQRVFELLDAKKIPVAGLSVNSLEKRFAHGLERLDSGTFGAS